MKGDSVGFNAGGLEIWPAAGKFDDKIIDAAGKARAAFSCAPNPSAQETYQGGRELLRKARVYVCKPDQLAKQSSSRSYEEYSC